MRLHATMGLIVGLGLATAGAAPAQEADPDALVEALREGGHVLYMRHASTETDYADQVGAEMGDCSTQRMLSEAGWREAREIGRAIARLGIPVGEVLSSEYCRAWRTADLAFGRHEKTPSLNFAPAENYSEAQIAQLREGVAPLLAAPPPPGLNTVIVGHDDPFEAATGTYPEPMGVAYVIRPEGGEGFKVLGHIPPDGWPEG